MRRDKALYWLNFAAKDLLFAEYGRISGEYDLAAFHCQQAVEKSLKAVLVFYDISPKRFRTHNIGELILALKEGEV